MRKLASLVTIDSIKPIPNAQAIEVARVGGWPCVVKKDTFRPGDTALYIEIDAFLPEGQPAWQFLVDNSSVEYNGVRGHALRTVKLRKQVSQGLLLQPQSFEGMLDGVALGEDVSQRFGIVKYVAPVPADLQGVARGMYPPRIPKTDQERIQNMPHQLVEFQQERRAWEVSEKLEGGSATYAFLNEEFHACSRQVDFLDVEDNSMWALAHRTGMVEAFKRVLSGRNIAVQGELVGPGIEGNIYKLKENRFYVYDIYDVNNACYLGAQERYALTKALGLLHVPVVHTHWVLDESATMDAILEMAVGPSALFPKQTREGLVFKRLDGEESFKGISNEYLSKQG